MRLPSILFGIDLQKHDSDLSSDHSASNTDESSLSIRDLKATGRMISKLQEGWDGIHTSNLDNFEKARVSRQGDSLELHINSM